MTSLPVVEIIGPTVQGEGPRVGRRVALIRLGGCNLTCESCDTRYSWDGSEPTVQAGNQAIMEQLADVAGKHPLYQVVITGGEPLIHQNRNAFRELVIGILARGMSVEIETNGTIVPAPWFQPRLVAGGLDVVAVSFCVSPKIVGGLATDPEPKRIKGNALRWFAACDCATFKIVCRTVDDVTRIGTWADINHINRHQIWIMPEGATWNDHITRARALVDRILTEGMHISSRLHLGLWPTTMRGR